MLLWDYMVITTILIWQQADKYKEEMLKISAELANDPNNQKLIDRKNELIDAQQQAILSAEDEKDSIKDLFGRY